MWRGVIQPIQKFIADTEVYYDADMLRPQGALQLSAEVA
jgi:hypothetical protein